MKWRIRVVVLASTLPLLVVEPSLPMPVTVTILADRPVNRFTPASAWGAALDGHDYSRTTTVYGAQNIAAMRSTHLGPITYRLRSELAIEAWHWNPAGTWSDPAHQQGYWTSSAVPAAPIRLSFGYRLPRRGRTVDDANNDGYSRIDDGDTTSFWKSNPYLDPAYTGEAESAHPQWVVIDLGQATPVNEARIAWGVPFPRQYLVEYWQGDQSIPIDRNPDGEWRPFPGGAVHGALGGTVTIPLAPRAIASRFVRLTLQQASHTAPGPASDPRDALGFALRELSLGTVDTRGVFHDAVRHGASPSGQSEVLVSSTDPWHRASDLDSNVAQPGFDLLFESGLTGGRPVLMPTGLLFDTPENAANELRYLRARGYPVERMELGEEPDGQRVTPEDYGALYRQFARALQQVDPAVTLGGPSFQTLYNDPLGLWPPRPSPGPHDTWIGRFVDELAAHQRLADFGFFSFEWYPFDDVCGPPAPHLAVAAEKLAGSMERLRAAGLPSGLPFVMTEFGYSAHASPVEIDLPGALFNVETIGTFFAQGGAAAYAFGFEPAELMHEPGCAKWGNLAFFLSDPSGQVRDSMPDYWAARLLTTAWADSSGGEHQQLLTHIDQARPGAASGLGAYALHRPDGRWSVLIVNRDPSHAKLVEVALLSGDSPVRRYLGGPVERWQYSSRQFQFHAAGEAGRPVRNLPPQHGLVQNPADPMLLPPMSITIVTGH